MSRAVAYLTLFFALTGCAASRRTTTERPAGSPIERGVEDAREPTSADVDAHTLPPPDLSDSKRLSLWATFYSVPRVVSVADGHPLLDRQGKELGPKLATRDFCDAGMEGTVQVRHDGRWRTYNYAGTGPSVQVDCSARYPRHTATGRSRFRLSDKPYGEGSTGARLVPFRSIAVDPRFVPYRTVLFIPAARGVEVELADGEKRKHDGYFFAADTGGAIKGAHVDIFLGPRGSNPFSFISSSKKEPFEAFVIEDADLDVLLADAHELQPQS